MERSLRRFYVAVSSPDSKLGTLMELLTALQADHGHASAPCSVHAAAVCCCSRDTLDSVVTALMDATDLFSVFVLHSDMSDRERDAQVALLRGMTGRSDQAGASGERECDDTADVSRDTDGSQTVVLVTTDVCLKALPKELVPLGLPLVVQYDLARNKDVYQRRVSTVCGSGKERRSAAGRSIVIDFVAAGEVAAFRASESWSTGTIREMPVHVAEVFQAA